MTSVLAILGGGSTLTLAVLLVVVLRWGMRAKDGEVAANKREANEKTAHGFTKAELRADLTTTRFELVTTAKALAAANTRADSLAKELSDALARNALGAGLTDDDVTGRLRKLAAEAAATGDPPRPNPGAVVPVDEPAATGETIAAAVHNLHPIDTLR